MLDYKDKYGKYSITFQKIADQMGRNRDDFFSCYNGEKGYVPWLELWIEITGITGVSPPKVKKELYNLNAVYNENKKETEKNLSQVSEIEKEVSNMISVIENRVRL